MTYGIAFYLHIVISALYFQLTETVIDRQAYAPHLNGRCPFDQFDCDPTSKEKFCVPFVVVRDCFPDCPSGEDEKCGGNQTLCDKDRKDESGLLMCGKCVLKSEINTKCTDRKWRHLCSEEGVFHCKTNQNCVPEDWLNDNEDDCGDGSDEDPCENGTIDCRTRVASSTSPLPEKPPEPLQLDKTPACDCAELLALNPQIPSGNFTVFDWSCTDRKKCPFAVYCDNEFSGGGWTMVMKRWDDSMNFNRSWHEYKCGFGDVTRGDDFWIGNDRLHSLTAKRQCPTELLVRMQPIGTNQPPIVAKYAHFAVAEEFNEYRLTLGPLVLSERLSAIDALLDARNNVFVTHDRPERLLCPTNRQFGFWMSGSSCSATILTAPFRAKNEHAGVRWGAELRVRSVELLIRPQGFVAPVRQ